MTITKALTKTTNCTFRAKKEDTTKKFAPTFAPDWCPNFQIRSGATVIWRFKIILDDDADSADLRQRYKQWLEKNYPHMQLYTILFVEYDSTYIKSDENIKKTLADNSITRW